MTPTHHIKPPSTFMEGQNLAPSLSASSSSSSSSSSRAFFSSDQDPGSGPCHHQELQSPQLRSEDDKLVEHQEVRDQLASPDNYGRDANHFNLPQKKEERSEDREDHNDRNSPKLLPTKIRIVRKMMSSSQVSGNPTAMNSAQKFEVQKQPLLPSCNSDSSNKGSSRGSTDNAVRVCSDCNTTKTPLWRSGPSGPKSLCNACGIRQRKARRALAAAAAAGGAILSPATSSVKVKVKSKTKRSKNKRGDDPRLERRCKSKLSPDSSPTKTSDLGHTDFSSRILGKHYSAYQRVFPQDEREAAILLMALSYGLVHG